MARRCRGISTFLAGFEETLERHRVCDLRVRDNPIMGLDVLAGTKTLATVLLLREETRQDLEECLPRLYRQE